MDQNALQRFKSRFLVGVVSTSLGTFIPMVIGFVGILLILRWVDQADFGVYAILLVLVQFFSTISEFGLRSAVIRNMQLEESDGVKRQLINSAMMATLLFALIASAVALLGRPIIHRLFDYELLTKLIWFLPPLLLLTNLTNMSQGVLQGAHRYSTLMVIRLLSALTRFVLVLLFVRYMQQGVMGLIYADLVSQAAMLVVSIVAMPIRKRTEIENKILSATLRFGFPLYLNNLLSFTFNRVDVMMIGNMTDADSVAACEVAERIPNQLKTVLSTSFMAVFFPNISELLAKGQMEKARVFTDMSLRVVSFIIMAVALVIAMLETEIVLLAFSERYLEVGPAFTIFMLALAFGMAGSVMGTVLVAAGFSDAPVKINLVAVTSNILGNLILIPIMGFTGAAIATFAMMAITLPVNQWYLGRKVFKVDGVGYLTPVILGLGFWAARHLLHLDALWIRIGLIVLYPILCIATLQTLRGDVIKVTQSAMQTIRREKPADESQESS